MAGKKREKIREDQVKQLKRFSNLLPIFDCLHDAATERDRAGNRILHFDQYVALQLIFFFNPIVTSLRALSDASALRRVQRHLNVAPSSLGSLSEAGSVFDAELLKPIIDRLGMQLQPMKRTPELDGLPGQLLAVDGTELEALGKLAGHMLQDRHLKLHTHFDLLKGVPVEMDVDARHSNEANHLRSKLVPDRVYVTDRGYVQFSLFKAIMDIGSHFVCRVKDNSVFEVLEDRPLSKTAIEAGILSDQIVRLGARQSRNALDQPVRVIRRSCTPHIKRSGKTARGGPEQRDSMLIATSLLDLQPNAVTLIYRKRWTVELFFRFFKHVLGCRHLLSHQANGIQIQVYMTIIVCMLIALWTGRKPTRRTLEMIQFYFTGWAEADELQAHIDKLKPLG